MERTSLIQKSRMQALSIILMPNPFINSKDFSHISTKLDQDFTNKLETNHEEENFEEEEEEEEFSFMLTKPKEPLTFADEIFDNGHIRPIFRDLFNQSPLLTDACNRVSLPLRPPLKKIFIEPCNHATVLDVKAVEASDKSCNKSNSTGFSKLWRFRRNLKLRSNSNGDDAFVFLNPSVQSSTLEKPKKLEKVEVKNIIEKKNKGGKHKMTLSPHEKHYVMNRTRKESDKHRSFLPYRVGFFTNVNSFSRNLHPF